MRWILIVAMLVASPVWAQEDGRIVVTGEGRITAVPDMATVRMGVTAEATDAADAMAQVSQTMIRVQGVLEAAGIAPRDIQTTALQLNPRWDNRATREGEAPRIIGYFAENGISVRVRDLTQLGDVLGAVVTDGANQFRGLTFDIADRAPLLEEARRAAVAEARAKAALYADAAGVTLGTMIELREVGVQMPTPMVAEMRMASADMAVPVAEGEMVISASVTMIFASE
ncbi:SIMPL domain-containing protein [Cognatishimia sp. MH4019]|uniref:SIMPL domain-containing protein n=1 Tax=Cognatishimia sp. MH4019 TaxID=2854030 RepID=UPI001CD80B1C|nr:SIMPL domain-containing protein [Cognatishimia sp. MH4019]